MTSPEPAPTRGRPRSDAADFAILTATGELLAEGGYEAVSMEAVAARAGVGKTTIYRRYSTRAELVGAAVTSVLEARRLERDSGSLRADLEGVMRGYSAHLNEIMTEVSLRLAAEAVRDERARAAVESLFTSRRGAAGGIIQRAAERGELALDVDADTLLDLIGGGVLLHAARHGGAVKPAFAKAVLDIVVTGLTTPPPERKRP